MQTNLKNAPMEALTKPSNSTNRNKKAQYNLRISDELLGRVKELGKQFDRPMNYVINHAIEQLLKQHGIS